MLFCEMCPEGISTLRCTHAGYAPALWQWPCALILEPRWPPPTVTPLQALHLHHQLLPSKLVTFSEPTNVQVRTPKLGLCQLYFLNRGPHYFSTLFSSSLLCCSRPASLVRTSAAMYCIAALPLIPLCSTHPADPSQPIGVRRIPSELHGAAAEVPSRVARVRSEVGSKPGASMPSVAASLPSALGSKLSASLPSAVASMPSAAAMQKALASGPSRCGGG